MSSFPDAAPPLQLLTTVVQGFQNLAARLERMSCALQPLFVTVTWGAGGSTAQKSLQLAEICQRDLGLTTCMHLTCTNMSTDILDEALEGAKAAGIRNILALRGDPPRNDEYFETPERDGTPEFTYAIDLVKYIRKKYGDYFCIGVAAYPEGHAEGTVPEVQDPKRDLPYLIEKVKAGADFIMTQLFYDSSKYIAFEEMLRSDPSGVFKTLPIIPGLMPIQSFQILRRTTKLSHASLPADIEQRLEAVRWDDAKVKSVGVDILADIIAALQSHPCPTPRGFHFYTLNLEKAVSFVIERAGLLPPHHSDSAIDDEEMQDAAPTAHTRADSVTENHIIVDNDKIAGRRDSQLLTTANETAPIMAFRNTDRPAETHLAISEGEGTLGREATWDDFPNGRFGDARSPAFGEIDGYGPTLHVSRAQALELWGYPVNTQDISELFIRHLKRDLRAMPWSDEELSEESSIIHNQLLQLNYKGWWTVASQPAVNGAKSDDPMFGWGPKGGYVYQKAFVEFFISPRDWRKLEEKLKGMGEEVSYYAGNAKGEYSSNMPASDEALNAVTWGCFTGKESVHPPSNDVKEVEADDLTGLFRRRLSRR